MTWDLLLAISLRLVLENFGAWEGILVLDDTGKKRSKATKRIPYVHWFKDKDGKHLRSRNRFLVLVTPQATIPVAFAFYQPDPAYSDWAREDKRLKKQGKLKHPPKNSGLSGILCVARSKYFYIKQCISGNNE